MKKPQIKLLISIFLTLICIIAIFSFSNMNSEESNNKSKNIISQVLEKVEYQKENVIPSTKNISTIVDILNTPLRKCAHASIYFILCLLVTNLLYQYKHQYKIKYSLIAIIFCLIYAITDEYHQTFIQGRTGQLSDVLIDTLGATIASLLTILIYKIKKNKKT